MAWRFGLPILALTSMALLAIVQGPAAAQPAKDIVVFDFEMMDSSAGSGIIPADEVDARYLAEATEVAKKYLQAQGAYKIVDTKSAAADLAQAGLFRDCKGCEARIASKLGGE